MIVVSKIRWEKQDWMAVKVPYDLELIAKIKEVEGRRWNKEKKHWHVPYEYRVFKQLEGVFGKEALQVSPEVNWELPTHIQKAIDTLERQLVIERKAYATIKAYKLHFKQFLIYYKTIQATEITEDQIKEYLYYLIRKKHISKSAQNQVINAIKAYYEKVLGQDQKIYHLKRPRKDFKLPNVMSKEEIKRLLGNISNLKHKCLIAVMYGGGLRAGELTRLKIEDVNFEQGTLFIRDSKGGKDRYTLLSQVGGKLLKQYLVEYQPRIWLFEGQRGDHYSIRSLQKVFERGLKKAGISRPLTSHSLRHSFATHMIEQHADLETVRRLLGHHSIKTTQIYLHVSRCHMEQFKSPLDDLGF